MHGSRALAGWSGPKELRECGGTDWDRTGYDGVRPVFKKTGMNTPYYNDLHSVLSDRLEMKPKRPRLQKSSLQVLKPWLDKTQQE